MRYKIFIILLFSTFQSFGQTTTLNTDSLIKIKVGFTPSNQNRIINGLAIGLQVIPFGKQGDMTYCEVNGLNIEVGLLGIVGGVFGPVYGLIGNPDNDNHIRSFFSQYGYKDSSDLNTMKYGPDKMNGVSISIGGTYGTINSGLMINGLCGGSFKTTGVQISGLINDQYDFKGLLIAGLANHTKKGKGVQIGLINNCESGHVFQIGLFNRIGRRILPFLNFSFKKSK